MENLGYAWLHEHFRLTAFTPSRPAQVRPVTRVEPTATVLAIPREVEPDSGDPLDHLLFALKHEGVQLQILAQVVPRLHPAALIAALRRTPGGRYLRLLGWLWEEWTAQQLEDLPMLSGSRTPLFDPARYFTGPAQRIPRWRTEFNGLRSLRWCATVERTPAIEAMVGADLLTQTNTFLNGLDRGLRDRTLGWAYLDETRHSFEIERQSPAEDRKRRFEQLLLQAHQRQVLSEPYLVELQAATVRNPHDQAFAYRTQQNWLGQAGRGAGAVSYLPPPPALVPDLMEAWMGFANDGARSVDALIAAAVVSFGFVYIHPFMDGNGRLSRFLFHHSLCRSGRLADGLPLPVSIAMHKHEGDYLAALRSYSAPLRERWRVLWLDGDAYRFEFAGDASLYRYWDATQAVEFGLRMAHSALELELKQESAFIARFDRIYKAVNAIHDVRGSDLTTLILGCLEQGNVILKRRRDQFGALGVPEAVFALIEDLAARDAAA